MPDQGRTLWEMLKDSVSGPAEGQIYNPLKAKIGAAATINEIDWKDDNFFLEAIYEYRRNLGGSDYPLVDYALVARKVAGDPVSVRLRLLPVDDPQQAAGLTHHGLLLQLDDELEYNEDLHKVVTDDTKKFQVLQDGKVTAEYYRINDVAGSYKANVTVIADANHDKRIDRDEVQHERIEYWDYWRETADAVGVKMREFLFVEMNAGTGWFQIWRGGEIDPQHVMMF